MKKVFRERTARHGDNMAAVFPLQGMRNCCILKEKGYQERRIGMPGWIVQAEELLKTLNLLSIAVRILLAMLCGGIIGIEREKANQAAGMRTYMLVCMGAAAVMLTGPYMFEEFQSGDPSRLGAQVISGIGFLGAGSIIISGKKRVKGLTTAAGLWVAGCIGLSIGIGFYWAAIFMTAAVFIVMSKLRKVEEHIVFDEMLVYVYMELEPDLGISDISQELEQQGLEIKDVRFQRIGANCEKIILGLEDHMEYSQKKIGDLMNGIKGVKFSKILS